MTIISSHVLSKFGFYVLCLVIGSMIMTTGVGLIYTLDMNTKASNWIAFQAVAGIGRGIAAQVPIIGNQASVSRSDIPATTAMTLCKSRRRSCWI